MWFGCGSDVARAFLGRGSDVARMWLSPARENLPQAIFLPQKMLWVFWCTQIGADVHDLSMSSSRKTFFFGRPGQGGSKRTERQRGGGLAPESCPSKTWTFEAQIGDFLYSLCIKGSISGAPQNSNFHPPSNLRTFDPPPHPCLQLLLKSQKIATSNSSISVSGELSARKSIFQACLRIGLT